MLRLFILVAICISLVQPQSLFNESACVDFNYGASQAAMAGLYNVYVCPRDGIAQVACKEKLPVKPLENITLSSISLQDVLFYILIGRLFCIA